MERLDRVLSAVSAATRSETKRLVREKRITVNGITALRADDKVAPGDRVAIDGEEIERLRPVLLMMNKPCGYVTSTDDPLSPTVMSLLPERYLRQGVFPVGRLDKDTSGLLLFTNDGSLAHRLITPGNEIEKEYLVTHTGTVTDEMIEAFRRGIVLSDGTVCRSACLVRKTDNQSLLTITEGKYHQVRRMMASCGLGVTALKRVREGSLTLCGLEEGEVREIESLSSVDSTTARS